MTQSKVSIPFSAPIKISLMAPMPKRCLGLSSGKPDNPPPKIFSHIFFPKSPADAEAFKGKRADNSGAFSSQIFKNSSLHDAVKRLSVFLFRLQTFFRPPVSFAQRFFVVIVAVKRRGALVKSENYIRPQIFLYLYGNFRVKFVFFSVISENNSIATNLDRVFGCIDIRCR